MSFVSDERHVSVQNIGKNIIPGVTSYVVCPLTLLGLRGRGGGSHPSMVFGA